MAYNGWTNFETWSVMAWLEENEGLHLRVQDYMRTHPEADYADLLEYLGFEEDDVNGDDIPWWSWKINRDEITQALRAKSK